MIPVSLFTASLFVLRCLAQNTFPHAYPGCLFAGNVGVNRAEHPNATLFFWAFEKANGSLAGSAASTDPWIIWLNGGPGASSLLGLMTEVNVSASGVTAPLRVTEDYAIVPNNYSWHQLADTIWVDQPVGTGYSTSDATGYVPDEDQMGADFVGFLSNMIKIFPKLATRPLYLMGESYAGTYIPYITKALFSTPNPPVTLKKIAIGDGTLGSFAAFEELPTLTTIETYPQLINYDPEVYEYFKTQEHLCGYDLNLTYPQNGHFPTLADPVFHVGPARLAFQNRLKKSTMAFVNPKSTSKLLPLNRREALRREERRHEWKRSIAGRPNNTLDPFYGCFLFEEMWDYAANFSAPWAGQSGSGSAVDVYNIPDALNPEIPSDPTAFLNDATVKAAIHAPTSKNWAEVFPYPFDSSNGSNVFGDPTQQTRPMVFLSELAANASAHGVGIVFYSGNDDSLVAHRGTEGFTRKPSTAFSDDQGNFAGIVHQERGLTYALFRNAGHPRPAIRSWGGAFAFVRDFVLGSNTTGLVDNNSGSVAGGEDPGLKADALPGNSAIYHWASKAGGAIASAVAPSATRAAWDAAPYSTGSAVQNNAAAGRGRGDAWVCSLWAFILVLGVHAL
ncbi:alpha/beta-hydrolase [Mycena olivaceomarginata]|nr:alpha/beta-hydrolase [Mycena olivaceomarginata]